MFLHTLEGHFMTLPAWWKIVWIYEKNLDKKACMIRILAPSNSSCVLIEEFQRLKQEERKQIGWSLPSVRNYRIHP